MRKQLIIWATVLATLSGLWVVAVQTQGVQCGGSFVPSLNCTISGRWLYTNQTTATGLTTQGPIPFQVRDQNSNPVDVTGIVSRETTLTNAQVIALGSEAGKITVVPAPGTGYYVDVISVNLVFNYTAAYTGGSNLRLYYGSRVTGPAASASITVSGFIVSVSADAAIRVSGVPDNEVIPVANTAIVLQGQGANNFGGGDAANSVRVVVNYRIVRTGL